MIEQMLADLYVNDDEWSVAPLRYLNTIGARENDRVCAW